jgi:hypothetical protein
MENKNEDTILAQWQTCVEMDESELIRKFNSTEQYDLFISHSFKDRELIIGLSYLFKMAGYKVYIDWIDDKGLDRNNVTAATAQLIKNRIRASKGMAYVSTANSTTSKWCPWELGVSDGLKGKVCILPVMNSSFKGQEYLGLYPFLDYERTQDKGRYEFWVNDQNDSNKYAPLRSWLQGSPLTTHD